MEILLAVIGGAVIVFYLAAKKTSGGSNACNDCGSSSSSLAGAPIQFLQPGSNPAGSDIHPPRPAKPTTFNQTRVRPDGPMYLYPVSNNNQQAPKPATQVTKDRLRTYLPKGVR